MKTITLDDETADEIAQGIGWELERADLAPGDAERLHAVWLQLRGRPHRRFAGQSVIAPDTPAPPPS